MNSGPENLPPNAPIENQYSGCCSRRSSVVRPLVAIFFTLFAMFFVSFPSNAQAHGIHGAEVQQLSALAVDAAVLDYDLSIETATDQTKDGCGTGCCSMSCCGYPPFKLPELVFPKRSAGVGYIFNYLPWVKNPLDSLQRPPRSLS